MSRIALAWSIGFLLAAGGAVAAHAWLTPPVPVPATPGRNAWEGHEAETLVARVRADPSLFQTPDFVRFAPGDYALDEDARTLRVAGGPAAWRAAYVVQESDGDALYLTLRAHAPLALPPQDDAPTTALRVLASPSFLSVELQRMGVACEVVLHSPLEAAPRKANTSLDLRAPAGEGVSFVLTGQGWSGGVPAGGCPRLDFAATNLGLWPRPSALGG